MIEFTRTSNAGGLLEMDGVRILLDGVSQASGDYLATPLDILALLNETHLDMMAFTHNHSDHFQPEFVRQYAKDHELPKLVGPKDVAADLEEFSVITASSKAGPVQVIAIPSRHIGAEYKDVPHYSFILKGSSMVWFMGDASPLQWQGQQRLPHPDLLIAPFAYATTDSAWEITEQFESKKLLLTHLPSRDQDSEGLWPAIEEVLDRHQYRALSPEIGQKCTVR